MSKTFIEIVKSTTVEKFNPYHDRFGRFTTAGTAISVTYRPGASAAHDRAIEREKERMKEVMPTLAQERTLKGIESRTRNLKKEQLRVVDEDGNVILTKQGDKNSVEFSVGEARENFYGNIVIHNHPDGGTFSTADINTLSYGAKEIRVAAPEGTYILRNMNTDKGAKWWNSKHSYDMKEKLEETKDSFKSNRELKKGIREKYTAKYRTELDELSEKGLKVIKEGQEKGWTLEQQRSAIKPYTDRQDAIFADINKSVEIEVRTAYTKQYHDWYVNNAHEYGLHYEFTPAKTRTRKSMYEEIDEINKSGGEVTLDAEDNKVIADVTEEITADILEDLKGHTLNA